MIDFSPTEWSKILQAVMHKHGITDVTITEEEIQEMRQSNPGHSILSIFEDHKIRVMTGPVNELQPILESLQSDTPRH